MSCITIYHNPHCGTSRNTLAMIRQSGVEPNIVEYLHTPPSRAELKALLQGMGMTVREVLREKGTPYAALDLGNPQWTDEQLLDFVAQHPILLNRPIVVTALGVRLCRPSEAVLDILPNAQIGLFTKEDGEVVDTRNTASPPRLDADVRSHTTPPAQPRPAPHKKNRLGCPGGFFIAFSAIKQWADSSPSATFVQCTESAWKLSRCKCCA